MKNKLGRFSLSLLLLSGGLQIEAQANPQLDAFLKEKDYLGLRVHLRKMLYKQKLTPQQWLATRGFITQHLTDVGYDMLYVWDKATPAAAETKKIQALKLSIDEADALMLRKDFAGSFSRFQRIAATLRADTESKEADVSRSAQILYPYILEGMGRSLYGMRRFKESAEVFSWIPVTYARFRRAQFEHMWASFQSGRVDHTLGRIASQFSAYFTEFNSPEAYLMQAYVHKKLCRENALRAVIIKMKKLRGEVKSGKFTWRDWVRSDVEGFVLNKVIGAKPAEPNPAVSDAERNAERARIERALKSAFEKDKPQWLDNMETAIAYAQLSTGKTSLLKPVEKLPSRAQLFKQDLEIWPADSQEEWIDEIGSHRFVGESQCGQKH